MSDRPTIMSRRESDLRAAERELMVAIKRMLGDVGLRNADKGLVDTIFARGQGELKSLSADELKGFRAEQAVGQRIVGQSVGAVLNGMMAAQLRVYGELVRERSGTGTVSSADVFAAMAGQRTPAKNFEVLAKAGGSDSDVGRMLLDVRGFASQAKAPWIAELPNAHLLSKADVQFLAAQGLKEATVRRVKAETTLTGKDMVATGRFAKEAHRDMNEVVGSYMDLRRELTGGDKEKGKALDEAYRNYVSGGASVDNLSRYHDELMRQADTPEKKRAVEDYTNSEAKKNKIDQQWQAKREGKETTLVDDKAISAAKTEQVAGATAAAAGDKAVAAAQIATTEKKEAVAVKKAEAFAP